MCSSSRSQRPTFHHRNGRTFCTSLTDVNVTFLWMIGKCVRFVFFETDRSFANRWQVGACLQFFIPGTDGSFACLWLIGLCVRSVISVTNGSFAFLQTIGTCVRHFIYVTDVTFASRWPVEHMSALHWHHWRKFRWFLNSRCMRLRFGICKLWKFRYECDGRVRVFVR